MEVKFLWAREAHRAGRFCVKKIAGEKNPADILTKPQTATDMKNKLAAVGGSIVHRNIWKTLSSMDRSRCTDMYESD